MSCIAYGGKVRGDVNNRIKETLNRRDVACEKEEKMYYLIDAINYHSDELIKFAKDLLNEDINDMSDFAKLKKNDIAKVLNSYYRKLHTDLNDYAVKRTSEGVGQFRVIEARRSAMNYVSGLIIDAFDRNIAQQLNQSPRDIANNVSKEINNEFEKRFKTLFGYILETLKNSENITDDSKVDYDKFMKHKDLIDNFINTVRKCQNIKKELNNYKQGTNEHRLKLQELAFADSILNQYKRDIVEVLGSAKDNNYLDLVKEISTNNKFIVECINNNPECARIANKFKKAYTDELDIYYLENYEDYSAKDDDPDTERNTDKSTAAWNQNAIPDSAEDLISGKFKIDLLRVYDLKASYQTPVEVNGKLQDNNSYVEDEYLGVRKKVDFKVIYNNLLSFTSDYETISSPDNLLKTLETLSKTVHGLYGIGFIVDKMKKDNIYKNFVYVQLHHPHVRKAIVSIGASGINVLNNNINMNKLVSQYLRFTGALKNTFHNFSEDNVKELEKINLILQKIKSGDLAFNDSTEHDIIDTLNKNIKTMYNRYNENLLIDYIHLNDNLGKIDQIDKYIQICNYLKTIISGCVDEIRRETRDFAKNEKYNQEHLKTEAPVKLDIWAQLRGETVNIVNDNIFIERPFDNTSYMNLESIEYINKDIKEFNETSPSAVKKALIELITALNSVNTATIEENSANAENNLSSNIIANSLITDTFALLKSDDKAQLDTFKEKYNRPQFYHNPLLFGIYDNNGNMLYPGIFKRVNGKVEFNIVDKTEIRKTLDYFLFDGIKNEINEDGATYAKLNQTDWFLTQLIFYVNGIKNPFDASDVKMTTMEKTPADATKIFGFEARRINTNNLFNKFAIDQKIRTIFLSYGIEDKIEYYGDNTINVSIKKILDEKPKNQIFDAKEFFDILRGEITEISQYSIGFERSEYPKIDLYYKLGNGYITVNLDCKHNKEAGTYEIQNIEHIYCAIDNKAINTLPKEFMDICSNIILEEEVKKGNIKLNINTNSATFHGYRQRLLGEFTLFINQLNKVFTVETDEQGNTWYREKTGKETEGLLLTALRNSKGRVAEGSGVNRKLIGKIFSFTDLFNVNDYRTQARVEEELNKLGIHLYGEIDEERNIQPLMINVNGQLRININCPLLNTEEAKNGNFVLNEEVISELVNTITNEWIEKYIDKIINDVNNQYATVIQFYNDNCSYDKQINVYNYVDFILNNTLMNGAYDDLFSSSDKFYKNAQTKTKRDKQPQMGGSAYASVSSQSKQIIDTVNIAGKEYTIYSKFNGVTAYNLRRASQDNILENLRKRLDDSLTKRVKNGELTDEMSKQLSAFVMKGYMKEIAVNDAQSYITEEEFIRRRYLDGTLSEYIPLLTAIKNDKKLSQQELEKLGIKIQCQKNIYVDQQIDNITGLVYTRQIKNSEFVLIPELIKGTDLENIYNVMIDNGIDQLNTDETSKASTRDIIECWNQDGSFIGADKFKEQLENIPDSKEEYDYAHLFKQQEIVDHLVDEENKVGIQIVKKMIDNISKDNPDVKKFLDNYIADFKSSYDTFLANVGWKLENGKVVNYDGNEQLDFTIFCEYMQKEVQRLGLNSNYTDYFTIDKFTGKTIMPNYLALNGSKLESVVNGLITHRIARQMSSGWHGTQVSGLCIGKKLESHPTVYRRNDNHNIDIKEEVYNKLSDEEKKNYTKTIAEYVEIVLPRWNSIIGDEEDALKKLEEEGLDKMIIYRMPTEGKQSVAIAKVVGFADNAYGSTVFVPDEWVTQTGSDFDIDSIYAMTFNFYKTKDGKYIKYNQKETKTEEDIKNLYIQQILEQFKSSPVDEDNKHPLLEQVKEIKNLRKKYKEQLSVYYEDVRNSRLNLEITNIEQSNFYQDLKSLPEGVLKDNLLKRIDKFNSSKQGYNQISKLIDYIDKLDTQEYSEEDKIKILKYRNKLNDIKSTIEDIREDYDEINMLNNFDESEKSRLFELCEQIAKSTGLISYEDFTKLTNEEQEIKEVRDNNMLQSFINILGSDESIEENLSRSNFEEIERCIKKYSEIIGIDDSQTQYNSNDTLYQLNAMNNGIVGTRLKAESVMNDTFISLCNRMQPILSNELYVSVIYYENNEAGTLYDLEYIKNNYQDYQLSKDKQGIEVIHNKYGWNKNANGTVNNRNVVGQLITLYGSQTTAHILDAVKTGAIPNENEFTFGVFKMLIGLGIDYDTAISFLMQPAVKIICEEYFKANSIYGDKISSKDILEKAYQRVNSLRVKKDKYSPKYDISLDTRKLVHRLKDYNKADPKFDCEIIQEFAALKYAYDKIHDLLVRSNPDKFGAKVTNRDSREVLTSIFEQGYSYKPNNILRCQGKNFFEYLYTGLFDESGIRVEESGYPVQAAALKYSTVFSTVINEKLFDLESIGFVTSFDNLKKINYYTSLITGMYTEINDDIYPSMKIVQASLNINQISPEIIDTKSKIYSILKDINKIRRELELSEIIYNELTGTINYDYQTMIRELIQKINPYYGIFDKAERYVGKKFSKKEYEQFKKYITSYIAYNNKTLVTPLIVDEKGYLIPSVDMIAENEENNTDFFNREIMRIMGINTTETIDFDIENYDNPSKEDVLKFAKLTPVQKIQWLQAHNDKLYNSFARFFSIDSFVRTSGNNRYKQDYIRFNEDDLDIEVAINEFKKANYNRHPFSKLLVSDLIKYAFIVDGFQFKRGAIAKIVANEVLLDRNFQGGFTIEDSGMTLIDSFNKTVNDLKQLSITGTNAEDLMDAYCRSHTDSLKSIYLKYIKDDLDKCLVSEDSYFIPYNTETAKKFAPSFLHNGRYIKLYTFENNQKVEKLYKVVYLDNGMFVYPISKLEPNEFGKYSKNNFNNTEYSEDYYLALLDAIQTGKEANNIAKELFKVKDFVVVNNGSNSNYISENKDKDTQVSAIYNIIEQQIRNYNFTINGNNATLAIPEGTSDIIDKLMGNKNETVQNIEIGGKKYTFVISKTNSRQIRDIVKQNRESRARGENKVISSNKDTQNPAIYYLTNNEGIRKFKLYNFVSIETDEITSENINLSDDSVINPVEELYDTTTRSARTTLLMSSTTASSSVNLRNIDNAAGQFAKDLVRMAKLDKTSTMTVAKNFRVLVNRGQINIHNTESLIRHKNDIFSATAAHYRDESAKLLQMIEHFEIEGEDFALNDEKLYEKLLEVSETNPQYFEDLLQLILYAKHFGDNIYEWTQLDLSTEDEQVKMNIESIAKSIDKIKNNSILNGDKDKPGAIANLLNIYFVKKYSNNPLLRSKLMDIRTTFGDINWFDLKLSTINDINNKEVQIVMKYINEILIKSAEIDAPAIARDFKAHYDKLFKQIGQEGLDKIIDKEGKWIQPYTADFIKQKQEWTKRVNQVRAQYGEDSIEYYKEKLLKDEWYAKNVEQPVVQEYYIESNKNLRTILELSPDIFIKYRKIQKDINNAKTNINYSSQTRKDIISDLIKQKQNLLNEYDENGILKDDIELVNIRNLQSYIKQNVIINKKYYDSKEKDSWAAILQEYRQFIDYYDKKHSGESLDQKLKNTQYREAYEWIRENAVYTIDDNTRKLINEAYEKLGYKRANTVETIRSIKAKYIQKYNLKDEYGNVDPRKLTLEEIKEYKEDYIKALQNESNSDESLLLKSIGARNNPLHPDYVVYKEEFYERIANSLKTISPEKLDIIKQINNLIFKADAVNTNIVKNALLNEYANINVVNLLNNLTDDDLNELANLYEQLIAINQKEREEHHLSDSEFKALAEIKISETQFTDDYLKVKNTLSNKKLIKFVSIFVAHDQYGLPIQDASGHFQPNADIYGMIVPKNPDEWIDEEKTEATKFITRNIQKTTIPEYYEMRQLMSTKSIDEYNEWFDANHIYNNKTHRYEPINLWTESRLREDSEFADKYKYEPTFENTDRVIKDNAVNHKYDKNSSNYNTSTGEYSNSNFVGNLNEDNALRQMYELLQTTMRRYSTINGKTQKFTNEYAPRERVQNKFTPKDILKGTADFFGFTSPTRIKDDWKEIIDYNHDEDLSFSMFDLLKHKNTKEEIMIRKQNSNETDVEYQEYLNKVKEENEKIRKDNLAIDNALLNRDWGEVFKNMIYKGENILARQKCKNPLYLLMTDIAQNPAFIKHNKTNKIIYNKNGSVNKDFAEYYSKEQTNLLELLQTVGHRIIYDEYKMPSVGNDLGRVLQAITSSKFMMFNYIGGIANVNTGYVNILGEILAEDYFTKNSFMEASKLYDKNVFNFIGDMYKEDSSNLLTAIVKLIRVVDYDEINGERNTQGFSKAQQVANDIAYSSLSMGEHMMQNKAALAMICDSKVYLRERNGKSQWVVGNFRNYCWDKESEILQNLIAKYNDKFNINGKNLIDFYNEYLNKIESNKSYQQNFDNFSEDYNIAFIKLIRKFSKDKSFEEEFVKLRKEEYKKYEEEFSKLDGFIDQFEFVKNDNNNRGYARLKKDSKLNMKSDGTFNLNEDNTINDRLENEKLALFINKARSVNQKIHGVYDKLGRASIENHWWGTLLMQYHKHLYPGIMKRYRGFGDFSGYYNEQRESIEKGSYKSLWDLLTFDFSDYKFKHRSVIDANGEMVDTTVSMLEATQDILKIGIGNLTNIIYNYRLLPEWEKANIRRSLGDVLGTIGCAAFVLALYGITDDDDLKESNAKAAMMYIACRCLSESYMYFPSGMLTEFETLYSQPIAAMSSPKDIFKLFGIFGEWMFNEDFNIEYTTGKYKGRNKIGVIAARNTPIYRIYDNTINMGKKNSYYNGLYSTGGIQKNIKSIADFLFEE